MLSQQRQVMMDKISSQYFPGKKIELKLRCLQNQMKKYDKKLCGIDDVLAVIFFHSAFAFSLNLAERP